MKTKLVYAMPDNQFGRVPARPSAGGQGARHGARSPVCPHFLPLYSVLGGDYGSETDHAAGNPAG